MHASCGSDAKEMRKAAAVWLHRLPPCLQSMAFSSTLCCITSFDEKGEDLCSCYFLGLVTCVYSNKGFSLCHHTPNKRAYCRLISSAQSRGLLVGLKGSPFSCLFCERFTWLSFSQFFHSCIVMMCTLVWSWRKNLVLDAQSAVFAYLLMRKI